MRTVIKSVLIIILAMGSFAAGYYVSKRNTPQPPVTTVLSEPIIMRTEGGLLEVSTAKAKEKITEVFPGLFFDTIVTVTVPATYRYNVELAPEWKFMRQDKLFVAVAPPVKPTLPVAIDTTGMTVDINWPFGTKERQQVIQRITPALQDKANSYLRYQREQARKTIAEFVTKWVLGQNKWKDIKDLKVVVLFPDESIDNALRAGLYPMPIW